MPESALRGVIAAIATPIDQSGEPDCARATKLARHLVDNGCAASTFSAPRAKRPPSRSRNGKR